MKKLSIILILVFLGGMSFAQKKAGTIYSEHEYIDKTKEFWKSFVNLDAERCMSYLTDSIYNYNNGQQSMIPKENIAGALNWWGQFKNLTIKDMAPATPDALDYGGGAIWVQDYLICTGIHKSSGINLNMPLHMTYGFNKEGKINVLIWNYDNDVIEQINSSSSNMDNGTIYINHPYINTTRKVVNAYQNMDIAAWEEFFTPNARFFLSDRQFDETIDIDARKTSLKVSFAKWTKLEMVQHGYPDCLHYSKGDSYVVYSWWTLKAVEEGGKKIQVPILLGHHFNKEGKIWGEDIYYSTNHLE